jgi:hypothetical protein
MSHMGDPHRDSFATYRGHVMGAIVDTLLFEPVAGPRFAALVLSVGCLAGGIKWSIVWIAGGFGADWLTPIGALVVGALAMWWWTRNFKALVLERLRREYPPRD